ncbi:MAG: hypothetical protein UHD09_02050 [Bifidobacterium sp.]|nr:hypothetical protein [Bifidobacterium sp.]
MSIDIEQREEPAPVPNAIAREQAIDHEYAHVADTVEDARDYIEGL